MSESEEESILDQILKYDIEEPTIKEKKTIKEEKTKSKEEKTYEKHKSCCTKCTSQKKEKICLCQIPFEKRREFIGETGCRNCGCLGCSESDITYKELHERRMKLAEEQGDDSEFLKNGCCRKCMKAFSANGKACVCQVPITVRQAKLPLTGCKICFCKGCHTEEILLRTQGIMSKHTIPSKLLESNSRYTPYDRASTYRDHRYEDPFPERYERRAPGPDRNSRYDERHSRYDSGERYYRDRHHKREEIDREREYHSRRDYDNQYTERHRYERRDEPYRYNRDDFRYREESRGERYSKDDRPSREYREPFRY